MKMISWLLLFVTLSTGEVSAQDYRVRYAYFKYSDSLFPGSNQYRPDDEFELIINGDSISFFVAAQFFGKKIKDKAGEKKYHHGIYTFPLLERLLVVNAWVKPYALNESETKIFNWDIRTQTRVIAGFSCKLALGNKLRVWYSDDIPVASGPAVFNGLPGLILRVEDYEHRITWEASSIKNTAPRIVLPDLPFGPCKDCESKRQAIKAYFRH